MKDVRWLLPFTNGPDIRAIDLALRQARSCDATIVAVSLCTTASQEQTSFEQNAQANVFLTTVQHVAEKYQVPVEQYQVFTRDALQSIRLLTSDLQCTSLVVALSEGQGALLSTQELRHLLWHEQHASLVLIRFPIQKEKTSAFDLFSSVFAWLHQDWKHDEVTAVIHPAIESEWKYIRKSR